MPTRKQAWCRSRARDQALACWRYKASFPAWCELISLQVLALAKMGFQQQQVQQFPIGYCFPCHLSKILSGLVSLQLNYLDCCGGVTLSYLQGSHCQECAVELITCLSTEQEGLPPLGTAQMLAVHSTGEERTWPRRRHFTGIILAPCASKPHYFCSWYSPRLEYHFIMRLSEAVKLDVWPVKLDVWSSEAGCMTSLFDQYWYRARYDYWCQAVEPVGSPALDVCPHAGAKYLFFSITCSATLRKAILPTRQNPPSVCQKQPQESGCFFLLSYFWFNCILLQLPIVWIGNKALIRVLVNFLSCNYHSHFSDNWPSQLYVYLLITSATRQPFPRHHW